MYLYTRKTVTLLNHRIMVKMYAQVETANYKGIFRVKQICGSIVSLLVDGRTTDFSLKEIKRFCTEDGSNFFKSF